MSGTTRGGGLTRVTLRTDNLNWSVLADEWLSVRDELLIRIAAKGQRPNA
ncbi:hypothetical protein ACF09J_24670 [Streptomyces sp. NPDC014889]